MVVYYVAESRSGNGELVRTTAITDEVLFEKDGICFWIYHGNGTGTEVRVPFGRVTYIDEFDALISEGNDTK